MRLVGGLDREAASIHKVLVWAVDDGKPPRTSTATLAVSNFVRDGITREGRGRELNEETEGKRKGNGWREGVKMMITIRELIRWIKKVTSKEEGIKGRDRKMG